MWIDIHAHLYEFTDGELTACLKRAKEQNILCIVNSATTQESILKVVAQAKANPLLYGTVGISPFDAQSVTEDWYETVRSQVKAPMIIGVGEIGLDASNPSYPPPAVQQRVFERLLELALLHDLPVILHCRGAEARVFDCCRKNGIVKALFHCYTGDRATCGKILDAGYFISVAGMVTYNRSVQDLVDYIPVQSLFIETDTPYLTPVPLRGKRNEPGNIGLVGAGVASIKRLSPNELSWTIAENFVTLFGRAAQAHEPL